MRMITIIFSLLFSLLAFADSEVPNPTLKFGIQHFKNGKDQFIALHFENHPAWHTYWKNPGDAGLAIKSFFTVGGKEIKLEEQEWPTPKRFIEPGDMWAYGYEGNYTLFYKINKPDFTKYSGRVIDLKVTWLICKHICVPGQMTSQFKIKSGSLDIISPKNAVTYDDITLTERFNNLPQTAQWPTNLEMKLSKEAEENSLLLSYEIKDTTNSDIYKSENILYAYPQNPFDFKHEKFSTTQNSITGQTPILWDGEYLAEPEAFPVDGKFKKPYTLRFLFNDPISGKALILEKTFANFDLNQSAPLAAATAPSDTNTPAIKKELEVETTAQIINAQAPTQSIFYYIIAAFIGGLILNIMPCVLPVISIKLFGLVKYKNESHSKVLKHNLFYTLGILATFLTLATIVLSLKALGTQVGWGFQLQSPVFISIMIIGLFVFALNLFGMFEFKTPGGNKLGNLEIKDNFTGDFLSGVLATVLSTPCSAPFLGTALTFAFSAATHEIYLIFTSIGLGLAFPFILTAVYPKLVAFIPKPGNWMNTVKKLLGVTLLLTTLWLFDVYNALVSGSSQLVKLGAILVLIFTAFLFFKKKSKLPSYALFLASFGLLVHLSTMDIPDSNVGSQALLREKQAKGLNWQTWSEEAMAEFKTNKQLVFIDFTAKWCFTCKVNEKLVLETDDFKKLVEEKNVQLLLADWTKRDEVIGSFLRKNKMVGVPAYFIQKPDGTLINLGETISIARIKEFIE